MPDTPDALAQPDALAPLDPDSEDFIEVLAERFLQSGGAGMAGLVNISEKECEQLYAFAFEMYESGRYRQSCILFGRLCRSSPLQPRYFKALGMARQMAGAYDSAAEAYGMATILDLDDPAPSVHAAECLLHCSELGRARAAVEGADLLLETRKNEELSQRLEAVRSALSEYDATKKPTKKSEN